MIGAIRRANKRRGHGTCENDRPPVVGTVGRESGQCRLRVRAHTDGKTWQKHVHGYTKTDTTCYTDDESRSVDHGIPRITLPQYLGLSWP